MYLQVAKVRAKKSKEGAKYEEKKRRKKGREDGGRVKVSEAANSGREKWPSSHSNNPVPVPIPTNLMQYLF